jgi:hypothetical protein
LLYFLKKQNPDFYSILFLWDSFEKYNWKKEIRYFNKVYTFDREDSKKYQIEYKPNFYVSSDIQISSSEAYDLFFAGKFSPSRMIAVEDILKKAKAFGIVHYIRLWPAFKLFLHNRYIYRILKRIKLRCSLADNYLLNYEAVVGLIKEDYLMGKNKTYQEMQNLLLCSNVVLDLPYTLQSGYSHRLIEALGNGKKIITTSKGLKSEQFYNSDQIRIIDIDNSEINFDWIKEKATYPISDEIKDLELSRWLKSIIDVRLV